MGVSNAMIAEPEFVLAGSLLQPLWAQFNSLLPEHPRVDPNQPLCCHRCRIPDLVVFDHVVAALVHGSGDNASLARGARIRRFADGCTGLDVRQVCVSCCITKAWSGGEVADDLPSIATNRAGSVRCSRWRTAFPPIGGG
jgi:hypothetical protein